MDSHLSTKEQTDKLRALRQYLCQHNVDAKLAVRIRHQVIERMSVAKRLSQEDVESLALLSATLRAKLWCEIYGHCVLSHSFLRICALVDETFLKDTCFHALCHTIHDPGQRIFQADTPAEGALFVHWGSLQYFPNRGLMMHDLSCCEADVKKGQWLSELALWTNWCHKGAAEAASSLELLTLSAKGLLGVIADRPDIVLLAKDYSRAICTACSQDSLGEVNDLRLPVDQMSLVTAMTTESRINISRAVLRDFRRRLGWTGFFFDNKSAEELRSEVMQGKCDLVQDDSGQMVRLVSVVALELVRPGGYILAQTGKWKNEIVTAGCKLPGTKVRAEELPRAALQRLLDGHLAPLREGVRITSVEVVVENQVSASYGVPTRYVRTVFHADLIPEFIVTSLTLPKCARQRSVGSTIEADDPENKYDTYMFPDTADPESGMLGAWILAVEFSQLTSRPEGAARVQLWVSALQVPFGSAEDHRASQRDGGQRDVGAPGAGTSPNNVPASRKLSSL